MASLETRNGHFRVVFRYAGRKFSRSLRTSNETAARASLLRLEDNLRRVELGTFAVPAKADVAAFLLSDGQINDRRTLAPIRTLSQLTDAFIEGIPENSIEPSTVAGMVRTFVTCSD